MQPRQQVEVAGVKRHSQCHDAKLDTDLLDAFEYFEFSAQDFDNGHNLQHAAWRATYSASPPPIGWQARALLNWIAL
jgi:hypothetical protein